MSIAQVGNSSLPSEVEVLLSLGVSPRDRLQVPSRTSFSRKREPSTPFRKVVRKVEKLVLRRESSLEFWLCEFVLFVCMAKGDEVATKTLHRLSHQLAELFCTTTIHPFISRHISLSRRQIELLTEEFVDLSQETASSSDTISLTHLTDIGLNLKELVQAIQDLIHTPPRFFARKMRALGEPQDPLEREEPRRKRQKTDPRSDALEITVTAPSGETESLLSFGGQNNS